MTGNRKRQANSMSTFSLPRRSQRKRQEVNYSPKRIQKCSPQILDLPNELLLMIFKLLPPKDLLWNINVVCKRWKALSESLWTKIEIKKEMPRKMIHKWFLRASIVRHLVIREREDLNAILEKVPRDWKELETLEIYHGTGSHKSFRVWGLFMCQLISYCRNLSFIHLSNTRFNSCTFFSLLPELEIQRNSKIVYVGSITCRELSALLKVAKRYALPSPCPGATEIAIKTRAGRCRVSLDMRNTSRLVDIVQRRDKARVVAIIWNANLELFNRHFNGEIRDLVDIW